MRGLLGSRSGRRELARVDDLADAFGLEAVPDTPGEGADADAELDQRVPGEASECRVFGGGGDPQEAVPSWLLPASAHDVMTGYLVLAPKCTP